MHCVCLSAVVSPIVQGVPWENISRAGRHSAYCQLTMIAWNGPSYSHTVAPAIHMPPLLYTVYSKGIERSNILIFLATAYQHPVHPQRQATRQYSLKQLSSLVAVKVSCLRPSHQMHQKRYNRRKTPPSRFRHYFYRTPWFQRR